MTIQCYSISDDPRKLNKTLGNAVVTLTGVRFKDDTSILKPVLDVAYNEDLFGCNYLHIGVLHRFYFIRNIITTNNRLYLECEVDPLYSHLGEIKELKCFIARQQKSSYGCKYLNDQYMPFITTPDISIIGVNNINMGGSASGTFSPISKVGTWIMSLACGTIGGN